MGLFQTKPIEAEAERGLVRSLGAGDLIMLGIGAVIGAGIFASLGTAAAGEFGPDGQMIRAGAGPALVFSFILLGLVCGLAALCYSELASMIPQAGSAYAYTYATLGELVAWIIGWALVLEYAVGNVAVAVAWSGYFTSMLSGWGIHLPGWLSHGYYQASMSANPELRALLDTAPHIAGIPVILNLPAFVITAAVTAVLLMGVRESARANAIMVVIKLLVLGLFVAIGAMHIDPANYTPFAPNGWRGIHQGAAIVFFAYIGFDAISTAAEETRNPQRNLPLGILGGLGVCTLIYVIVGIVATGIVPYTELAGADPLAKALSLAGLPTASWIVAAGAVVSMTAVLLVFQYGQTRIFFGMAKDGLLPKWATKVHPKRKIPHVSTLLIGLLVGIAALFAEENVIYDLVNIGTLAAFFLVCIGVMVLRYKRPELPRPFRVPFVYVVGTAGALACLYTIWGLPSRTWVTFGVWMAVGLAFYFSYGYRHSVLRTGK
ncbi:MAG TPA: amino acid permease, partial [Gemmatimonadales bacterium]|nr:amino acid permease [Gemmatimonadales bacterium]